MLPIATVDQRTYSALRAYFAARDIDRGTGERGYVWDLRSMAVNRWTDDLKTSLRPPGIHYTLYFRRADEVTEAQRLELLTRGIDLPDAKGYHLLWEAGTFPEEDEPAYRDWELEYRKILLKKGDRAAARYEEEHPRPPETSPNPQNWPPDRAQAELERILPEALELWSADRQPIDWRPKIYLLEPPPEP